MTQKSIDPAIEIGSLIEFAEVISSKIEEIRENLEKINMRTYILIFASLIGIPTGLTFSKGIKAFYQIEIYKESILIYGSIFLIFAFSILASITLTTLQRRKSLNRELSREIRTLKKLIDLIDCALAEIQDELSIPQRALLEMRLQRLSF